MEHTFERNILLRVTVQLPTQGATELVDDSEMQNTAITCCVLPLSSWKSKNARGHGKRLDDTIAAQFGNVILISEK